MQNRKRSVYQTAEGISVLRKLRTGDISPREATQKIFSIINGSDGDILDVFEGVPQSWTEYSKTSCIRK